MFATNTLVDTGNHKRAFMMNQSSCSKTIIPEQAIQLCRPYTQETCWLQMYQLLCYPLA